MSTDATKTIDASRQRDAAEPALPGLVVLFTEGCRPARRVHPIVGAAALGRLASREIHIEDPSLSRVHATFRRDGATLVVEDAGSHNGTFVDGERVVEPRRLAPGDLVRAGGTLLLAVGDVGPFAGWPDAARVPPLTGGPAMAEVRDAVQAVAATRVPVLLFGETGTGKGLAARAIHALSGRKGEMVAVNCAAIPEALFEAELFGAARGAFTGAVADRAGLIRAADGGTLFLDEVADLPAGQQAKLLTAIEEQVVRPVGSARGHRVDVRFVAAASEDLDAAVAAGRFRRDLFYRLRGFRIALPPLRDRRDDIALLALDSLDPGAPRPSATFMERAALHPWPGNVRELQQAVRSAAVSARLAGDATMGPHLLPAPDATPPPPEIPLLDRVRDALAATGGNVSRAAGDLGIRRERIYALLRRHGLKASDFR